MALWSPQQEFKRVPVKLKLALILIVFAIGPSLIVGCISYIFARNLAQRYELNVEALTADLNEMLDTLYPRVARDIELLSHKSEFADIANTSSGAEIAAISEILAETQEIQNLYRVMIAMNRSRQVVASHRRSDPWIGQAMPDLPEIQNAMKGQLTQSEVKRFELFGKEYHGFWTHMPVYSSWDHNQPVGLVSAFYDIGLLKSMFDDFKIDGKSQDRSRYIQIFDGKNEQPIITPAFTSTSEVTIPWTFPTLITEPSKVVKISQYQDSWSTKIVGVSLHKPSGLYLATFVDEAIVYRNISTLKKFVILSMFTILFLVVACILPISRIFTTPLFQLLKGVEVIGKGDFDSKVTLESNDEFGILGHAFNTMTGKLKASQAIIEQKNNELLAINQNLEQKVLERTHTIQTILNNVKSGFLIVDHRLEIMEGFTRSCNNLFGQDLHPGMLILDALQLKGKSRELVKIALRQIFVDDLPAEVSLSQVPSRFAVNGRILALEGSELRDTNGMYGVLYTVIDATQLQKAELERKTNQTLIKIIQNRDAFRKFLTETKSLLAQGTRSLEKEPSDLKVREVLHTLKGNAASFGLFEIAQYIHEVEEKAAITMQHLSSIKSGIEEFLVKHQDLLELSYHDEEKESYSVSKNELEFLNAELRKAHDLSDVLPTFESWLISIRQKSARLLLGPLPDYAEVLASRLGKKVKMVIEGGQTPMLPEVMMPVLQCLTHLVRNSIDHGIEFPWDRGTKDETGLILFRFSSNDSSWKILISDDGRGIDHEMLAAKAVERNIISPEKAHTLTYEERCNLIFHGGLSTSEAITEVSGRGIGMAAVEEAVKEAGGQIQLQSAFGKGTSFEITVPKPLFLIPPSHKYHAA